MKGNRINKTKRGSVFILSLVFVSVLAISVGAMMYHVQQETRQTHRARLYTNSLEAAKASMLNFSRNVVYLLTTNPPNQTGGDYLVLDDVVYNIEPRAPKGADLVTDTDDELLSYIRPIGSNTFEFEEITNPTDDWYGYKTARLDYELVTFARETTNNADTLGFKGAGVKRRVTLDYIPLYAFAIFYEETMELHPGPTMNVRGRVHSNDNMYLSAVDTVRFHEKVTSAKNIYRFRGNDGSSQGGKVEVKVPDDKYNPGAGSSWVDMSSPPEPHNGDDYLDHLDEGWFQAALDRWKSQMMDSAHGINPIRPPLPTGSNMYDMFRRADSENDTAELKRSKLEYLADIIVTGDPGDPSTIRMWLQTVNDSYERTLTELDSSVVNDVVSVGEFYDGHQQTTVRTLDIDMGALNDMDEIDWSSSNGVIYVSTTPGDTDSYSLAEGNQDPIPVLDSEGNVVFDTDSRAPIVSFEGWMADGRDTYMPAVRVVNADTLPENSAGAFAFYSDRPVYTVGDINKKDVDDRVTAVIGGDSMTVTSTPHWLATKDLNGDGKPDTSEDELFTILDSDDPNFPAGATRARGYTRDMGNDWREDEFSWDKNQWYSKPVGNIETNTIFLMGDTSAVYENKDDPTSRLLGSGGAHNVMRYLENWNKTHNYNGSILVLFQSPVAMHKYRCCDGKGYYDPPTRNYNWDESLKGSTPPPGMPALVEVKDYPMEPIGINYAIANKP